MGRKKISFRLNERSIRQAIIEVERYEMELKRKLSELMQRLADEGVEIAKMKVAAMDAVFTGQLYDSIKGYYSPSNRVAIIRAGIWYAAFVEYGTGVEGARAPHPKPEGWAYDVNDHGDLGWWYLNDNDSKMHWTKGEPARPFMYETARELEERCESIAREVFGA